MADYTTAELQYNKNTDASPDFTGTAIAPGGSSGANELRWCATGAGGASTPSASWPGYARPVATGAVPELWAFSTNTSGIKVATYDGTNAKANVFRWHLDNTGTPVSAPQMSFFATSALPTPVAGTQPSSPSSDGSGIVNGQSSDTSSHSYIKINAFGQGITSGGVQQTPSAGSVGTLPTATTQNAAGAVTPGSAAWLTTWQDAQGWIDYILGGATWQTLTAVFWYWTMILFSGPNLTLGTNIGPVAVLQYNFT